MSVGRYCLTFGLVAALGCGDDEKKEPEADINRLDLLTKVLNTNADIAYAGYADAVDTAEDLKAALQALIDSPSEATHLGAKQAWLAAREPYGQTEVFRFRASPIDDTNDDPSDGEDGPEGSINAWPLGEGLIDYVKTGNDFGADQIEVSSHQTGVMGSIPPNNIIQSDITIDDALLDNSATAEDEHDVIAGYHAIEFLLWGQDLSADGSADTKDARDATPGQRPYTDFVDGAECTSGDTVETDPVVCQRRGQYLIVAVDRLIRELSDVRDAWKPGAAYHTAFTGAADLAAAKQRLIEILTGMGTLSEGELAGERMQISLSAGSQEDEHSCFSDNTHRDIWLNAEGVSNAYFGRYAGFDANLDGTDEATDRAVMGYGVDAYLRELGQAELADRVSAALAATQAGYVAIDASARAGTPVDVMIMDAQGEAAAPMRTTIVALNAQAALISAIADALDLDADVVDPDASECDTTDPTSPC